MTPFDMAWGFQVVYWLGLICIGWNAGSLFAKFTHWASNRR